MCILATFVKKNQILILIFFMILRLSRNSYSYNGSQMDNNLPVIFQIIKLIIIKIKIIHFKAHNSIDIQDAPRPVVQFNIS